MTYRKKPVEVDAIQWNGENIQEVLDFCYSDTRWKEGVKSNGPQGPGIGHVPATGDLDIPTLEGTMNARPGDWIIRGIRGELYPCKPDIFEQTYDKSEETLDEPTGWLDPPKQAHSELECLRARPLVTAADVGRRWRCPTCKRVFVARNSGDQRDPFEWEEEGHN